MVEKTWIEIKKKPSSKSFNNSCGRDSFDVLPAIKSLIKENDKNNSICPSQWFFFFQKCVPRVTCEKTKNVFLKRQTFFKNEPCRPLFNLFSVFSHNNKILQLINVQKQSNYTVMGWYLILEFDHTVEVSCHNQFDSKFTYNQCDQIGRFFALWATF